MQRVIISGFVLFLICALFSLVGIANLTGLPFWDVASQARVLMIAPVMLALVWLIEHMEIPLPFRLENTWPVIVAAFWIGIHTLIVMKAEQSGVVSILGYSMDIPTAWVDLPWYAGNWCRWTVFALILAGGYLIRSWRSDAY
jgi:hypothetical protein